MTSHASSSSSSDAAAAPVPGGLPCFIRAHREARVLWVFGSRIRFLIDSADTGGRYSLVENYTPAFHPGPPPHVHTDAEEMFHVLDGALKVMIAGQTAVAHAGDTLIVPRNVVHTFSNPFLTACRYLVQITPGGFERFFEEIGVPPVSATDLLTPPDVAPPAIEQLKTLAIKYHMRVPGVTD